MSIDNVDIPLYFIQKVAFSLGITDKEAMMVIVKQFNVQYVDSTKLCYAHGAQLGIIVIIYKKNKLMLRNMW